MSRKATAILIACALSLGISLCSWAQAPAAAQDAVALRKEANAAYQAKRFAESAALFEKAAAQPVGIGTDRASDFYNAACAAALDAQHSRAFRNLDAALDAGLMDPAGIGRDPDFASLHRDSRWEKVLAKVSAQKAGPRKKLFDVLMNQDLSSAQRYFAAQEAERSGMDLRSDQRAALPQYYANMATFVGDYVLADALYLPLSVSDVGNFTDAREALPALLPLTRDRKAVFINESHGRADSRTAAYRLLAPLREQGFDTLALEDLGATAAPAGACERSVAADVELAARGYPIQGRAFGYYMKEPVYAALVREALRLGYRLVAYESTAPAESQDSREDAMATTLSCLFKTRPQTKLLALAGFSHISEAPTHAMSQGGMMAYRFKQKSGIDPLTIDTTKLLHADLKGLTFNGRPFSTEPGASTSVGVYVLADGKGELLGDPVLKYDVTLFIPPAVGRDASPNWLELAGARRAVTMNADPCKEARPCLVDVVDPAEGADALPQDRCVLQAGQSSCRLFLAPGSHLVRFYDERESLLSQHPLRTD